MEPKRQKTVSWKREPRCTDRAKQCAERESHRADVHHWLLVQLQRWWALKGLTADGLASTSITATARGASKIYADFSPYFRFAKGPVLTVFDLYFCGPPEALLAFLCGPTELSCPRVHTTCRGRPSRCQPNTFVPFSGDLTCDRPRSKPLSPSPSCLWPVRTPPSPPTSGCWQTARPGRASCCGSRTDAPRSRLLVPPARPTRLCRACKA